MATPGQLMFARRLGPTARLLIWLLVGASCVVLDTHYHALEGVRSGFSLLLQPVREATRAPAAVAAELGGFFTRHRLLQKERDTLLAERARLIAGVNAARDLARENAELRALMQLQTRPGQQMVRAASLYQGHDWFSQRITLDLGAGAGLRSGLPVIDTIGLVGQVSRVFPGASEVTLVSNPDQLTPVFVERTGQRGLAAGSGHGQMELRYMPTQTDIRPGDRLLTSGIDRVYPAGIPVARVSRVSRSQSSPYLRVECLPLAGLDRSRAVLVLVAEPRVAQP
ncbi:rod shape-determining protein MreC [Thiobacillus sp. 65-1402]|uniref:rod shape-determining protein MreC n=1 Tax=Thiobacillus sp. 65-1402 TaxID=1895861 RepID=UPI000962146A|nr:rod shape-determining protein MreC [Thiobacillus sp. 65-1402]OJW77720.1 MAG: rod shape-determining protein MreC [Thiobacillus sp. 65-1402]